jgi:hypothetical protein
VLQQERLNGSRSDEDSRKLSFAVLVENDFKRISGTRNGGRVHFQAECGYHRSSFGDTKVISKERRTGQLSQRSTGTAVFQRSNSTAVFPVGTSTRDGEEGRENLGVHIGNDGDKGVSGKLHDGRKELNILQGTVQQMSRRE